MRARVAAAWNKWRELSGVISDRKMPRKLKVKLYNTIIRSVFLYGAEVWTMGKEEERILEVTEIRMLRRIKGGTLRERERSTDIRRELGVSDINEKVKEIRMRWCTNVKRREERHPAKVAMESIVPGRRPRGRPKKRWRDNVKEHMSHFGVRPEEALERETWRRKTRAANPGRGLLRRAYRSTFCRCILSQVICPGLAAAPAWFPDLTCDHRTLTML
ncbi:uncharacterized protein LOC134770107 [Penaeus indicus]|uniref:uncharacterized protein LOC134770107 n=1 Tax=Penaeus indicus TaxID=29960 RepID=UPI00300C6217